MAQGYRTVRVCGNGLYYRFTMRHGYRSAQRGGCRCVKGKILQWIHDGAQWAAGFTMDSRWLMYVMRCGQRGNTAVDSRCLTGT
ncbi:hypothetical protein BaRGS_00022989, partial [Batillaria attramentaria]